MGFPTKCARVSCNGWVQGTAVELAIVAINGTPTLDLDALLASRWCCRMGGPSCESLGAGGSIRPLHCAHCARGHKGAVYHALMV